jgi:hypothetical protein
MSGEIDFLKGQQVGGAIKTKFLHSLKVGTLVLILAYCLASAAVFSYWLFLSNQTSKVNNEITVKKTKIAALKDVESLQVVLKQRLFSLDKFFSSKKGASNFNNLLAFINQISADITIRELKIAEDKMDFTGLAPNMMVLENFLKDLKGDESSSLFSKITLSSIDRQEDGSYLFSVLLEIKK